MDSNYIPPAIVITGTNDCASPWHDMLLGIEEEGIPFQLQHHPSETLSNRTWPASPSLAELGSTARAQPSLGVTY
uniref:glycerol dehydratase reactivase beta/small subunit family protein n=1 Tax=Salmonella enterica TaxID=28901 RepID=UPI00398C784F